MRKTERPAYNVLNEEEIIDALKKLRMPGMLASYKKQKEIFGIEQVSFKDRLGMMLYEEVTGRAQRRQARLLQVSGLRNSEARVENLFFNTTV